MHPCALLLTACLPIVPLACRSSEVAPTPAACPQQPAPAPATIALPAASSLEGQVSPRAESFLPRSRDALLGELRKLDERFLRDRSQRDTTALEIAITYGELEARAYVDYLASCEKQGSSQPCDDQLRAFRVSAHESAEKWCRYLHDRFPGQHECRASKPRRLEVELDGPPLPPSRPDPGPTRAVMPVPPCVAVLPAQCPGSQVPAVGGCAEPNEVAHLDLNAIPSSEIYVNSCWVGVTPRRALPVRAGKIEVTFESDRGRVVRRVETRAGEKKTVVARAN